MTPPAAKSLLRERRPHAEPEPLAYFRPAVERALAAAGGVELTAPAQVSGIDGRRVGRRTGNALEFSEYRDYRPGDDLRRIDWRVYARSEQLMIKLYSEEVDPRCDVILDHSASMAVTERKASAAISLAAIFATAAANSGFSLNLWHAADTFRKDPAPASPLLWDFPPFETPFSPSANPASFSGQFFRRGIRILITDLMGPDDPAPVLSRLADGAKRAVVVMVLDPLELEPEPDANVMLIDAETGEERELVLDEGALARYHERLEHHRAMWAKAAASRGVLILPLSAADFCPEIRPDELFHAGLLK
jgi:uncharacterized protein (DUF58 family)